MGIAETGQSTRQKAAHEGAAKSMQANVQGRPAAPAGETGGKSRPGISAFTLKLIAIFGMTLDHIGIVFGASLPLYAKTMLYALGGLTFPIMAYLLVEGYKNTKNFRRYALRLLAFALISFFPFAWALYPSLNIMFTLFLGLLSLYLYDNMKNRPALWLLLGGFCLLSIFMDWGLIGIPMILISYTAKNKWQRLVIPVLFPIVFSLADFVFAYFSGNTPPANSLPGLAYALVGCSLSVPLLACYKGRRGRALKYLFYAYYPGHLLLLGLLRGLILGSWVFF